MFTFVEVTEEKLVERRGGGEGGLPAILSRRTAIGLTGLINKQTNKHNIRALNKHKLERFNSIVDFFTYFK